MDPNSIISIIPNKTWPNQRVVTIDGYVDESIDESNIPSKVAALLHVPSPESGLAEKCDRLERELKAQADHKDACKRIVRDEGDVPMAVGMFLDEGIRTALGRFKAKLSEMIRTCEAHREQREAAQGCNDELRAKLAAAENLAANRGRRLDDAQAKLSDVDAAWKTVTDRLTAELAGLRELDRLVGECLQRNQMLGLAQAYAKLHPVPAPKGKCPLCKGTGRDPGDAGRPCDVCHGTGTVPAKETK